MDIIVQVGQLLLMLSILVILHEFGHYITAKMFKVRVEKFYLFMDAGFALVKKKIGETEWGIGWLPLGGYVKLSGMIDESMDTDQMKSEPQPWEFRSKPAWQRLIIMLGGIIVNLILAWLIYTVVYSTYGKTYASTDRIQEHGLVFGETGQKVGFRDGDKIISVDGKYQKRFDWMILDVLLGDSIVVQRNGQPVQVHLSDEDKKEILDKEGRDFIHPKSTVSRLDSIIKGSPAEKAGLRKGDSIVGMQGSALRYNAQISEAIYKNRNGKVVFNVIRNGAPESIVVNVPEKNPIGISFGPTNKVRFQETEKYSVLEAMPKAIEESYSLLVYNIKQFKLILRPSTGAYTHVNSVVGIAAKLPTEWDWEYFWKFTALFSIGLAFMNVLPIPGLDGGHAIFTIAEMITGRRLSDKAAGVVQTVGMVILLTIMALTFGKDIYQLVKENFF